LNVASLDFDRVADLIFVWESRGMSIVDVLGVITMIAFNAVMMLVYLVLIMKAGGAISQISDALDEISVRTRTGVEEWNEIATGRKRAFASLVFLTYVDDIKIFKIFGVYFA